MAVAVVQVRDLFSAAMLFAIYSLLSAGLFAVLDAGDVALTEAAVGAGISTILFVAVLALARREEHPARGKAGSALVVTVTGACLIYAAGDLPDFGQPTIRSRCTSLRITSSSLQAELGVPNMVAAVLARYRSIDTIGEVIVIFTAGLGVFRCCRCARRRRARSPGTGGSAS